MMLPLGRIIFVVSIVGLCQYSCFSFLVIHGFKVNQRDHCHNCTSRRRRARVSSAETAAVKPYPPTTTTIERRPLLINTITSTTTGLLLPKSTNALTIPSNTPPRIQNQIILPGNTKPFPLASFGLQIYSDEMAYTLTLVALEAGFRNFFASVLARNQQGFARAIRDSGIPRQDIYICGSVLSHREQGEINAYRKTKQGCQENIINFSTAGNIEYLDMIMLDYPGPDGESIRGQWRAMEEMKIEGLVNSLAVSNFSPRQLDELYIENSSVSTKPVVNQLPYSIANHPSRMIEYNRQRGILVQSWSPLSTTLPKYKSSLEILGKKYGKSAAQIALRWIIETGASFCMQSKRKEHFKEDLDVFDFSLTEQEVAQLSQL